MVKLLKKFLVFTLAIMLLAIPMSGCADNENNEENDEPNTPGNESGAEEEVLALTKSVYILTVGGSEQLKIDFKENGQTADVGLLTISSKNTDVATVSNGTVNGVALGQTELSVSRGDTVLTVPVYVVEEATLEQVNSFDEQYINIYGRSYLSDGKLKLDHTTNGVDLFFKGETLSVTLKASANSYMRVFIDDDTEGRRLAVSIGTKSYVVAQGLEAGNHKIRIVKITEMQDATWEVQSFSAEGFFAAPAKSELKLEFIGDSITAGYGVLGKQSDQKTIMNSDASKTYAYLTAQKMNADYSVIAWSGICTKAPLWGPGMDVLYGDVSKSNTADYAFDFNPDVVVINLGTNDQAYLQQNSGYAQQFPVDYKDFLTFVREKNPDAYIICLYGMMGKDTTIDSGIRTAVSEMNDTRIVYNPFTIYPDQNGGGWHPSTTAQKNWTELLVKYINNTVLA